MKLLAAMSGGVDSAVAAARAVDAGHDVTGVHLALSEAPQSLRHGARGCCSVEDANDARRSADVLGIPFYVWDLAERFRADVIDDFVAEYAAGRTPNPCLRCNEKIKFAAVLDRALALGFDAVVTGHHARLVDGRLLRSVDPQKDQSYVLAVLRPDQLAHAVFPVGDSTKAEVRAEAEARGLAVARKPDSHDICFIADGDTRAFLGARIGTSAGAIIDADSGERSRVRTTAPSPSPSASVAGSTSPARPPTARRATCSPSGRPTTPSWSARPNSSTSTRCTGTPRYGPPAHRPAAEFGAAVQLRAHGVTTPARVRVDGDTVVATLDGSQRGIAPGQAAVFYDGDAVLGSATITAARRTAAVGGPR